MHRSVFEMFDDRRPALIPYPGPFDGFHAATVAVSKTCMRVCEATTDYPRNVDLSATASPQPRRGSIR
jgi:hypothetical protein